MPARANARRPRHAAAAAEAHETAERRLHEQRQRLTPARADLLDVLASAGHPLTITEILDGARGLAQSSVYRNLVVLEQAGIVHRLVSHDEFARFELAEDLTGHHHHLVCSNCGRVDDLPASESLERSVAAAVAEASRKAGFRTERHRLDLVGLCAACS